ncbi:MAG: hypothetical protein IPN90_10880 [Elusimicrobia bacterium]|nr:hypothetical protein [Elusimicrobiota bacterium]
MLGKKTALKKKRSTVARSASAVGKGSVSEVRTEYVGTHYVGVDFPQVGEILTSGQYSIRVSTSATEGVEISIDGKEWEPCRESVGFWWFDWSGFGAGVHTVVARILVGKRFMKSKPRSFTAIH